MKRKLKPGYVFGYHYWKENLNYYISMQPTEEPNRSIAINSDKDAWGVKIIAKFFYDSKGNPVTLEEATEIEEPKIGEYWLVGGSVRLVVFDRIVLPDCDIHTYSRYLTIGKNGTSFGCRTEEFKHKVKNFEGEELT